MKQGAEAVEAEGSSWPLHTEGGVETEDREQ